MKSSYAEKLKDPRWQKKRLEVMERDKFACIDCGENERTLTVHHCHYVKGGPWETPSKLLMTLCMECHELRQGSEDELRELLGEFNANARIDVLERVVAKFRWAVKNNKGIIIGVDPL